MTGKQLDKGIKQVGFVVLLVALFIMMAYQLQYFMSSLLGAFTLYMLLRTPYRGLLNRGWNKFVATSVLLLLAILAVFVVGGLFIGTIYSEVKNFNPQLIISNLTDIHDVVLEKTGYNIFSSDVTTQLVGTITQLLPNIFSVTGSIVTNAMMMVFILFFMLHQSREMENIIEKTLPLTANSTSMLKKETKNMVVSNAIGIPVIMIGQGVIAGVGYWILGIKDPFIWGTLTGLLGLIPVIGTAGIWLPLSINLFISNHIWQGVVLILYGITIIASVDNLIRMVFLKKYADVHPLVTIFGIILGMNLFGFWGIIFGPLLISGFVVLVKIYRNEFLKEHVSIDN